MIDIYFIRHGQTEENFRNWCQGQTPGTLSKQGLQQAEQLSEELKSTPVDCIYTSDLSRTVHTAKIIAQYHPEVPLIEDRKLRERYMAEWQGKAFPPNWHQLSMPPGAESHEDLMTRATAFLEQLQQHPEQKIVWAVSHGGMIRAFCTVLGGKTAREYYSWPKIDNTSVTHGRIDDNGHFGLIKIGAAGPD